MSQTASGEPNEANMTSDEMNTIIKADAGMNKVLAIVVSVCFVAMTLFASIAFHATETTKQEKEKTKQEYEKAKQLEERRTILEIRKALKGWHD